MKNRDRLIVVLLLIGSLLFGVIQFVLIPRENEKKEQYALSQKEPSAHDLNSILKYKSKYMGDHSNLINLFYNLPLSDVGMKFQLFPKELTLQVEYQEGVAGIGQQRVEEGVVYDSIAAFSLIDNLKVIRYDFPDGSYQVERGDVEKRFGSLTKLLEAGRWQTEVQEKFLDHNVMKEMGEEILKTK